jgi:hypothetical protein
VLSAADVASMQATLTESFAHQFVIERNTPGAVDDYNQPAASWATLATISGTVTTRTVEEVAQQNDAGAVVSTHEIVILPTDVVEGDRIRHTKATCPMTDARDLPDALFALVGIRNTAGTGIDYTIDARLVSV